MKIKEGTCFKGGVNDPPVTPPPPPPKGQGTLDYLEILGKKEALLSVIIVWLKAKNLWEECKKDLSIKNT